MPLYKRDHLENKTGTREAYHPQNLAPHMRVPAFDKEGGEIK